MHLAKFSNEEVVTNDDDMTANGFLARRQSYEKLKAGTGVEKRAEEPAKAAQGFQYLNRRINADQNDLYARENAEDGGQVNEQLLRKRSGGNPEVAHAAKKGGRPTKKKCLIYSDYQPLEIAEFIENVEAKAPIWDSSNDQFHRKETRNCLFDQIEMDCSKFMMRGGPHGDTTRKLWDQLLAAYRYERNKMEKLPSVSGTYKSNFPFMGNMSFVEQDRSNRSVENSFVFGTPGETRVSERGNPEKLATPKRKRKDSGDIDKLLKVMEEGNRVLERSCSSWKSEEPVSKKENEDLYELIDTVLAGKNGLEKLRLKSDISNFLFARMGGAQTEKSQDVDLFSLNDGFGSPNFDSFK